MIQGGHGDIFSYNFSGIDRSVLAWLSCDWSITVSDFMAVHQTPICTNLGLSGIGLLRHHIVNPIGKKVLQVRLRSSYIIFVKTVLFFEIA